MHANEPIADRDNPELHVTGKGDHVDPNLLFLDIKPETVVLMPRKIPKLTIVAPFVLFTPFFVVFGVLVYVLGENPWRDVGLVTLVWGVTCGLSTLISRAIYRRSLEGPWMVIDRQKQTLHLPRTGETIPFAEIDHLLDIGSYPFHQSKWSSEPCSSEFHLVLKQGETLRRVPLFRCRETSDAFRHLAKALAGLNWIPVKQIRGIEYSRMIIQRWLTPEQGSDALYDKSIDRRLSS